MSPLNDEESAVIAKLEGYGDPAGCIAAIRASANPRLLQQLAFVYNWDDGFEIPQEIADHDHCDLGTAITLFWLAEAMSFYMREVDRNEYNNDWADFCELLIGRIISDHYKLGPVSYKPEINSVTAYKYKKQNIPSILYKEIIGVKD